MRSLQELHKSPHIKGIHILRREMGCQNRDNSQALSNSQLLHHCATLMTNSHSSAELQQGTNIKLVCSGLRVMDCYGIIATQKMMTHQSE